MRSSIGRPRSPSQYSRELDTGSVWLETRLQHALFDKLVYSKLRDAMGGRVEYSVSGGAALGERLGHFFRGIGMVILEGYGLTETTAGATISQPDALKIGTVGRPLPGVTVRIADDGEILFKGGHVFKGYYNNEDATAEAIDSDGWFHTGDLGQLDDDGFLRITGRKKEIIVTAGGKNVAPAVLEDRIRSHFLVSQAMVVGDGEPFIAALVTIDAEAVVPWAKSNGKPADVASCSTTTTCAPRSSRRSTTPTRRCPGPSRCGPSASCPRTSRSASSCPRSSRSSATWSARSTARSSPTSTAASSACDDGPSGLVALPPPGLVLLPELRRGRGALGSSSWIARQSLQASSRPRTEFSPRWMRVSSR